MFGPKSLCQNAMCQIFVNDIDFVKCIPMWLKMQAGDTLEEFLQDVGIPVSNCEEIWNSPDTNRAIQSMAE